MNTPDLIHCQGLSFAYSNSHDLVLKNVNLSVQDGDFLVLIGPNGGGKTTLIKLLLGFLTPTIGSITYANRIFRNMGYVPQVTSINTHFPIRVIDVVRMGFLKPKFFGFRPKKNEEEEALYYLNELGIAHLANEKIGDLSGGQRQRVMIARALCGNSKVIILDEPTSNIDQSTQKNIYDLLKKYNKTHTMILISHDLSILMGYATKVLFVNQEVVFHDMEHGELSDFEGHLCEADILNHFLRGEHAK
ncbi:MAG: ABC transporter ATP-binding protein [Helicobacter sp.]|nr:ABC transporter ATP-binding protein [Helicobacter sp.]